MRGSLVEIYFAARFRGPKGDKAPPEKIAENKKRAIQVGHALRSMLAGVGILYIPHEERLINMAWEYGDLRSDQIIGYCCDVVSHSDMLVALKPTSFGMEKEVATADAAGKLVVWVEGLADWKIVRDLALEVRKDAMQMR